MKFTQEVILKQRMEVLYTSCVRGEKAIEHEWVVQRHRNREEACGYTKFGIGMFGNFTTKDEAELA